MKKCARTRARWRKKKHWTKWNLAAMNMNICDVNVFMMNAILIRSLTNAYKNYFITNYIIKVMGLFLFLHSSSFVCSLFAHIHASDIFVVWFSFIFECSLFLRGVHNSSWCSCTLRSIHRVEEIGRESLDRFCRLSKLLIILESFIYGKYYLQCNIHCDIRRRERKKERQNEKIC